MTPQAETGLSRSCGEAATDEATNPNRVPDMTDQNPCAGCGLCCAEQGTPPFTRCGKDRPPPELDWDIEAHEWRYDDGLPCLWYDTETKRCRHYEHRPQVCREEVVPGDEICNGFRVDGGLIPLPML